MTTLCSRCSRSMRVEGDRLGDAIVYCTKLEKRITFPVTKCTAYTDRIVVTLWQLEQIAWNILTDRSGKKIGFRPPAETKRLIKTGEVEPLPDIDDDY